MNGVAGQPSWIEKLAARGGPAASTPSLVRKLGGGSLPGHGGGHGGAVPGQGA